MDKLEEVLSKMADKVCKLNLEIITYIFKVKSLEWDLEKANLKIEKLERRLTRLKDKYTVHRDESSIDNTKQ